MSPLDYQALKKFLLENLDWFEDDKNEAVTWHDFEQWPTYPVDRRHLIMPGEYFMTDATGTPPGWFGVCRLSRNGKPVPVYAITTDMRHDFGTVVNGFWVVPKLKTS